MVVGGRQRSAAAGGRRGRPVLAGSAGCGGPWCMFGGKAIRAACGSRRQPARASMHMTCLLLASNRARNHSTAAATLTLHQVAQEFDQWVQCCRRQPPGARVASQCHQRQALRHFKTHTHTECTTSRARVGSAAQHPGSSQTLLPCACAGNAVRVQGRTCSSKPLCSHPAGVPTPSSSNPSEAAGALKPPAATALSCKLLVMSSSPPVQSQPAPAVLQVCRQD